MRPVWLAADHHFGHANILKFKDDDGNLIRPDFRNVDDMDEMLIELHNDIVSPGDLVYMMGDVSFHGPERTLDLVKRLNGRKRFLLGNHDLMNMAVYAKMFQKITLWRRFRFEDVTVLLTHVPVHPSSLGGPPGERVVNAHGHTHQRHVDDPRYYNVCLENTGFKPINLDVITEYARRHA